MLGQLDQRNSVEESQEQRFMDKLKIKLLTELNNLRVVIKAEHKTLESLCDDDLYMNHLGDAMWASCKRDTHCAPTWMTLFFWGSVSEHEDRSWNIKTNPRHIMQLAVGNVVKSSDLKNRIQDDSDNKIMA